MKFSKEIKAGLIAVVAIVGFVLLYQFMKGRSFFSLDDVYYVKYDNVEGLNKSSPVSINGLKMGQVLDITPVAHQDGSIDFLVKILVDDNFSFSKNSTVSIYSPGLMSDNELKIDLASDGPMAKTGDTLIGKTVPSLFNSLKSEVDPIKDQLTSTLTQVDSLAGSANKLLDAKNRQEFSRLLVQLNQTIGQFSHTAEQVNKLLDSNQDGIKTLVDNTNKTVTSANATVENFGKLTDQIEIQKLNESLNELNNLLVGINEGKGSLGKLAKDEELYKNLNESMATLNAFLEDLKTNPKRYINISVFGK